MLFVCQAGSLSACPDYRDRKNLRGGAGPDLHHRGMAERWLARISACRSRWVLCARSAGHRGTKGYRVSQSPPQDAGSVDGQSGSKSQGSSSILYFWVTSGVLAIITTLITVVATTRGHGGDPYPLGPPPTTDITTTP